MDKDGSNLRGKLDDHLGEVTVVGGAAAYLLFALGVIAHDISPTLALVLMGVPPLFLLVVALGACFTVRLLTRKDGR